MQHTLDLFVFNDTPDGKCREECITIHVAQALELPLDRFGSLVLRGHPPDAGFEVVSRLSRMLHGMLGKQDGRGPEKSIPCDVSGAPDYYSGYSLQQVWL